MASKPKLQPASDLERSEDSKVHHAPSVPVQGLDMVCASF